MNRPKVSFQLSVAVPSAARAIVPEKNPAPRLLVVEPTTEGADEREGLDISAHGESAYEL